MKLFLMMCRVFGFVTYTCLTLCLHLTIRSITAGADDSSSEEEEEALPRGWHAQVNDAGEMYYQNRHTEEWTQEVPEHPAAPEGWQALSHDEHGTYWFHEATQTTQWHHPHDAAPDAA